MSLYLARYLNVPPDRIPGEGGGRHDGAMRAATARADEDMRSVSSETCAELARVCLPP